MDDYFFKALDWVLLQDAAVVETTKAGVVVSASLLLRALSRATVQYCVQYYIRVATLEGHVPGTCLNLT